MNCLLIVHAYVRPEEDNSEPRCGRDKENDMADHLSHMHVLFSNTKCNEEETVPLFLKIEVKGNPKSGLTTIKG